MKDLQGALFGNPKVGLQPSELQPSLVVLDREVESKVEDGVILKLEEHDDAVYRKRFRYFFTDQ